jgi:hypothetical protein
VSINNTKPWWQSLTIWSGLGQILVLVCAVASGVSPDPADASAAGSAVAEIATGLFALLTIIGRFRANKKIG